MRIYLNKKLLVMIPLLLMSWGRASATQAVLAVSLGMPDKSLSQYIQQAHQLRIPVVIRGLYFSPLHKGHSSIGSFRDTELRIKHLIGKHKHGGIAIDPMVFRSFNIKVVPTLVVFDSANCVRKKGVRCETESFDVISGNIPMSKQLEIISRKSTSMTRKTYCDQKDVGLE